MKTLIKNGTIITAEAEFPGDILIDGETVKAIGKDIDEEVDEVVDASGKYVMPGAIDQHTHFLFGTPHVDTSGKPTADLVGKTLDYTYICLMGGTTTIIEHTTQQPNMTMEETLEFKKKDCAEGVICCDYGMHAHYTEVNDATYENVKELPKHGVCTLKLYLPFKDSPYYASDEQIFRFMEKARDAGMTVYLHCENADIVNYLRQRAGEEGHFDPSWHLATRPMYTELEAIQRCLLIAKAVRCPICILHVSSKEGMEAIRDAREEGAAVIGETVINFLVKDTTAIDGQPWEEAVKHIVAPPVRGPRHKEPLWKGLRKGWLDILAADHSPTKMVDKERGRGDFRIVPNGAPALGDKVQLAWTWGVEGGRISKTRLVEVMCANPAKMQNIFPKKGTIMPGSDADIVIYDPSWRGKVTNEESPSGIDYNAYEGMDQIGRVDTVFLRGTKMVEKHKFIGPKGTGKFIPAKPYGLAWQVMEDDWRFED